MPKGDFGSIREKLQNHEPKARTLQIFRVRYIAILRLLWVYRYNNQRGENLPQRLCYKMVFSAVPF